MDASSTHSHTDSASERFIKFLNEPLDEDLITTDQYLSAATLKGLWEWYGNASQQYLDPQVIFVKMVNAIRKPYLEKLNSPEFSPNFTTDRFMNSNTCYTPSEVTMDDDSVDGDEENTGEEEGRASTPRPSANYRRDVKIAALQSEVRKCKQEVENHRTNRLTLSTLLAQSTTEVLDLKNLASRNRIAIKSYSWTNRYVQLDGTGVTSQSTSGNGSCIAGKSIGPWETFELIRHEENIVSFKSISFQNVYLRAHAKPPRGKQNGGAGVMSAGFGCGPNEKFILHPHKDQGIFTIESVAFPKNHVRLDGGWPLVVNMQAGADNYEFFYLIMVPQ